MNIEIELTWKIESVVFLMDWVGHGSVAEAGRHVCTLRGPGFS